MKTKTFKIGEYCTGGIITVQITGKIIVLILKEWDYSTGSRRSSDQSQAKELMRGTGQADDDRIYNKMYELLTQWTTSFYAEEVIKWISSKVSLSKSLFW